jgi:hypothetical protein
MTRWKVPFEWNDEHSLLGEVDDSGVSWTAAKSDERFLDAILVKCT